MHITVPYGRRGAASERPARSCTASRILTPEDVRIHRGLPVTSPARTLLDNAATLPDREVEQMLDEALFVRRILTRRGARPPRFERAGGHPGRARLARVAGEARGARAPNRLRHLRSGCCR